MEATEIVSLPPHTPFSKALSCQKCNCHDASVRQVIYPFVFSFFVITFRREFHGRWCWKHRALYLFLAVLISGTMGWLGFPFGLIYTPLTLYRLASGRVMHKASNLKLLRSLAEAHEQRGLLAGASSCLEASLHFVDDLWGRQQLARYDSLLAEPVSRSGPLHSAFVAAGLFAVALVLGGLAGFGSHFLDKIYDLDLGSGFMILAPIFFWMPLAMVGLLFIFALRQLLEKTLENHAYPNPVLLLGTAVMAGLLTAYGFLEGRELGNLLDILQKGPILPPGAEWWAMLGAAFTRGGLLEIPQELRWLEYWNFFHHGLLLAIPVAFPFFLAVAAWPYVSWERLLTEIRLQANAGWRAPARQVVGGAVSIIAFGCLSGLPLLFPQLSLIDFIEARDHFYAGNEAMNREAYESARVEYQTAVQLDPRYSAALVELGWTYYQLDDHTQAITQYSRALELAPDRAESHYDLGRIFYHDGQLENAAAELEAAIRLAPDDYYAYLGLGWVAYDLGDLEKAEANFRTVLKYNDREYDPYLGLGYIYEDRDQLEERISAYQQAVASSPASADAQLLLGIAYFDKNELDQAVVTLEKAVALERTNRTARFYLTQAYIDTGHPDTALTFGQETLKLLPEWAGAHALLANALLETRQADAAEAEIRAAREISLKTDGDRGLIIRVLLNADLPVEAEQEASQAIKDGRRPAGFYLYLASAYLQQDNVEMALATCEQAEKVGAKPADVLLQRANIHLRQKNYRLSLEEIQKALELEPGSNNAHELMGLIYMDQGKPAQALAELQQVVALDRYHFSGHLNLAAVQLELNNSQESIRAASRAALLSPYEDMPHYLLGMAYFQNGQDRNAAVELRKFLDLYQENLDRQDMKDQAEETLKKINKSSFSPLSHRPAF